ncbi:ABC transporter ATP-binding protein [Ginsengibacter hankyongi]|uniref:ABC transporter ATP-binding protein n=1 Tax=Ginsengibacter hankyongi TaxID=2607284 RepID=A0A5J5IBU8_9BACT|nr:ABC transporter ATP-binding protein [Ginsengibacter hankyongi]KAA9034612.1 ABC transporter ATP-binding protein [Ginsengibacter hankyongi]
MSPLASLNKYFWKYKWHFLLGMIFIILSNYFRILTPQVTKYVLNTVEVSLQKKSIAADSHIKTHYDPLVRIFINQFTKRDSTFKTRILYCGIMLLVLALISGFFMFLMRQTIIVMSRHIEYAQKNEIFNHYQQLDTNFYKTHNTGDLMNRISEDVSRVRMYTGPALMYLINLAATIGFSVTYMYNENKELTFYVLSPLPILAVTIYYVNTIINRKSDKIQSLLSDLTTNAQESYSGIRVIKSFVQEKAMLGFFEKNSELYRRNAISLAKTEAIYFPSMGLIIGISTLLTILTGGLYVINGSINIGVIGEFIMYILMLTFPVMAIGWTASMIQRAATSQRRINEFLHTTPTVANAPAPVTTTLKGNITFDKVDFVYPHTGIHAIKNFSLVINKGEKVAIIGKTGSGKSTIAQLMLRMYDPPKGNITYDGIDIKQLDLTSLRSQISYVPQDVFLFSDTVENNIGFALEKTTPERIYKAAANAAVAREIEGFPHKYTTMIGERGVTLSGGQKQRISIARALLKEHEIVLFDDCLSAVDAKTENEIIGNLYNYLHSKTAVIITHRIFSLFNFDKIIVLQDGAIAEEGTHRELLERAGLYAEMYYNQQQQEKNAVL